MKGRVTSLDIAHLAGVSQPTVSRALRGSPLVSAATRRRVLEIAEKLNYKVDKNASNLRCQHSGTLALLLFEDPTPDESQINPFFLSMLGSITRACAVHAQDLLISFQQLSGDWHADYEDAKKADGIILLGYGDYLESKATLERLVEQGTHFVRWGAVLAGTPGVSIGCDNVHGGREMTRHLIAQGCRRIGFLGHADEHYPEFQARWQGYCEALREAGLEVDPALQADAVITEESGHAAVRTLIERGSTFDGLFAASDIIAIGALRALAGAGVPVPDQVKVGGFDDIPVAGLANPPLSTVQQDTKLAGTVLVETLLALIANQSVESRMLPTRLLPRRSTGAAPD